MDCTHCDRCMERPSILVYVGGDFRRPWWISVRLNLARHANFSPINSKFTTLASLGLFRIPFFLQTYRIHNSHSVLSLSLDGLQKIMMR